MKKLTFLFWIITSMAAAQTKSSNSELEQKILTKAKASTEYKTEFVNMNKLKIQIDLAKNGTVNKQAVVNRYNELYGKVMGKLTSFNSVETKIKKTGDNYLKVRLYQISSDIALSQAAEL